MAAAVAAIGLASRAAALPPNFVDEPFVLNWNLATGLTFGPDGRLYVWEKAGRVWTVVNGVKSAQPLIDISEEVGNWRDHGLLGFAVDPNFAANGYIYLMYVVDYYHLINFGQPGYDPALSTNLHDTIGRITRYTATAASGFDAVDPLSRFVLLGESITTGIPICHQSHGVGTLMFAPDGTLLASVGDGAAYNVTDAGGPVPGSSNTALADGIIKPKEDVGAFRAQLVDSLSGKILRIDPASGDGVPSNPFFDALAPRAPRSRVWALGLRNPFRFTLRPGTGSANAADGNPGAIYIGDVGWNLREDLNVCTAAGQNFGWPLYEGLTSQPNYAALAIANQDAPNPLFNTTPPGQLFCAQQFLPFRNLLIQDTLNPSPSWPNPCDPAQSIPPNTPTFVHRRPAIDWKHGAGPSRTGIFSGFNAAEINLSDPASPVPGPNFGGNSSTGGVWYTGTAFPPEFQNVYFHGDFGAKWLRAFRFHADDRPESAANFVADGASAVVAMALDSQQSALYYIEYLNTGVSNIRRIRYTANQPPTAIAAATPTFGPAPLAVQFSSAGSQDPEGQPLTYRWDFDDGTLPSAAANPSHLFELLEDISAQGTIIGRVFQLNPPGPTGGGNPDPEIIRDGVYPPVGSSDSLQQFDTYHAGAQGNFDWLGYSFAQPREFRRVIFQEGKHFGDGGYWETLGVQVRSGVLWTDVQNLVITPLYPGNNGLSYESFQMDFTPAIGEEIRIVGNPGGSANFFSVGELRVVAAPLAPITTPVQRNVTLTVTDALNNTAQAVVAISLNNTPPQIEITSPLNGSTYSMYAPLLSPLTATITDTEHSAGELTCSWQIILHHNDHTHPEPPVDACTSSAELTPVGCDGELYFYEVALTVTDAAGLSTTASSFVYPDCAFRKGDFDTDYDIDATDTSAFRACYTGPDSGPVAPPCAPGDFDSDGDADCADWLAYRAAYLELNGVLLLPPLPDFVAALLGTPPQPVDACLSDLDADGDTDGDDISIYLLGQ